jgi:hypothetical protein
MAKTLEAHDKLVGQIFQGDYRFEVPDYQRPYAWTVEQANELFGDLKAAMEDAQRNPTNSQYFLGSIVLIKKDREPKSLVVDGQQRLTTLTILFAALRAAMPDVADQITDFLYRKGKSLLGEPDDYRLSVREEDVGFFRKHVQEPGGIGALVTSSERLEDSRLRFRENATVLLQSVKSLTDSERAQLFRFIATECSLVVISTPDLEAAYRIFSVLNDRGLDLAPIDILKADILGKIRRDVGDASSHAYAKRWSEIESTLGREAFGELFAHIRTVYAKLKQRATLVKEFREYVTEYNTPVQLIDNVIQPYAEAWDTIREADFEAKEHAEAINEYLRWLNRVDFKDWVPPALLYFTRFKDKPSLLVAFLRALERLTYFLLVTREGINERIERFAHLTREVESPSFDGDVQRLPSLELSEAERRDFAAALDGDIYKSLPKARATLLLRLESLLSDGSKSQEFSNVSIEHVLPQNPAPSSEWMTWFPDEEVRESWTHRLANLVPLHIRKNPAASNFAFGVKKNVYFARNGTSAPFILTNEVRSEAEWTPVVLESRQHRLANVLLNHWRLS